MPRSPKIDYTVLTDEEIVGMILAIPHNEEAAGILLYDRYNPLLRKIYFSYFKHDEWYADCVSEFFMYLRGKEGDWRNLSSFQWRSTFGCWLRSVASHEFGKFRSRLIENDRRLVSIDDDDPDVPQVQLPDGGEEDYERRQRKVMLMEAIGLLRDDDQRFVVLKRLEGYNSREIAVLLQKRWQKHGIVKYGRRKGSKEKHVVVPDVAYVDIRFERAKENLRTILHEME